MGLKSLANKVPEVTILFWLIKIIATTLGETGGDALSMTLQFGYAVSTLIFFGVFVIAVAAQVAARAYHPFVYWAVIVATTTAGTTLSDYLDRSLDLGYIKASLLLFGGLCAVLGLWRAVTGSVAVNRIADRRAELFYWVTILVSSTLGTGLGDFVASDAGLGFGGGALLFGGALTIIAIAYFTSAMSRTVLFWMAFILTRPLGATLGDLLTKPRAEGGLHLSRIDSSLVLAVCIVGCVLFSYRQSQRPPEEDAAA